MYWHHQAFDEEGWGFRGCKVNCGSGLSPVSSLLNFAVTQITAVTFLYFSLNLLSFSVLSTLAATERKMHLLNNYSCFITKLPPALSSCFFQGKAVFSLCSYRPSSFRSSACDHKETLKSLHTPKIHNPLSLCCWRKLFPPWYFDGTQQSFFAHQPLTRIGQVLKSKHRWGQNLFSRGHWFSLVLSMVNYAHCQKDTLCTQFPAIGSCFSAK